MLTAGRTNVLACTLLCSVCCILQYCILVCSLFVLLPHLFPLRADQPLGEQNGPTRPTRQNCCQNTCSPTVVSIRKTTNNLTFRQTGSRNGLKRDSLEWWNAFVLAQRPPKKLPMALSDVQGASGSQFFRKKVTHFRNPECITFWDPT